MLQSSVKRGGGFSFPLRIFSLLVLAAALVMGAWRLFPPGVRVDRPRVDVLPERVAATTNVTNNTGTPREITVRFTLGRADRGSSVRPSRYEVVDQKDVSVRLESRVTQQVSCDFRRPQHIVSPTVDAQAVAR